MDDDKNNLRYKMLLISSLQYAVILKFQEFRLLTLINVILINLPNSNKTYHYTIHFLITSSEFEFPLVVF